MKEHLALVLVVLLTNVRWDFSPGELQRKILPAERQLQAGSPSSCRSQHERTQCEPQQQQQQEQQLHKRRYGASSSILLAEAKGVAGLGKAGGEGTGGADKAGQQVPPEVYMALTYAGTLFLFTLSVPLILYGLNKLLNKIEDCLGCGSSAAKKRRKGADCREGGATTIQRDKLGVAAAASVSDAGNDKCRAITSISASIDRQTAAAAAAANGHGSSGNGSGHRQQYHKPTEGSAVKQNLQERQLSHNLSLQLMHQHPKFTQFVSVSNPDYAPPGDTFASYTPSDHPAAAALPTAASPHQIAPFSSPLLRAASPVSCQPGVLSALELGLGLDGAKT